MDLAAICEVLQATQQSDATIRKAAEAKLEEAGTNAPSQLVQALTLVLAAGGNVAPELRQEASVLLRRRVANEDWDELDQNTQQGLKTQILLAVQNDPVPTVQRNAGFVVAAIAQEGCEDLAKLMQHWPELLPWLAEASVGASAPTRVVALGVLKELVPAIGEEMLEKNSQVKDMLGKALVDQVAEVRAAGAQLTLTFVQHLQEPNQLGDAMPMVTNVLQGLATGSTEKELEETLAALVLAAEEESAFFFENTFQPLWATLMTIVKADASTFANPDLRHVAMESMMVIAEGNNDEEGFKEFIEGLIEINFMWMVDVEEDVAVWTEEGRDSGEDDCDGDCVRIGEENFDRLGTSYDEDELMPILFKVLGAATQNNEWKHVRSAIMAVAQVLEHLEDEARTDQCIDFILRHFTNEHPRVRYNAFTAIAQASFDQTDRIQEKYAEDLMPVMLKGMKDDNIRVVTASVEAFSSIGEDMDAEELEDHMEALLELLFKHLGEGKSRHLQEQCIDSIAAAAQAAEEMFVQYYGTVMPLLKQVIGAATSTEQRNLRGKAFLCASVIGTVVGKEVFAKDGCEVMDAMVPMFIAGFAADDKTREFAHEASGNIAQVLGRDFKGYAAALLPSVFAVLQQTPKDISELLEDEDGLDDIVLNDLGAMGLKTSALEEMDDALELIITLAKNLEEDFCDFIGATCQIMLPMLDYPLSEDVRETVFKTWGQLASGARAGVEQQKLDPNVLRELVQEFLKKTVGQMSQGTPADVCENNITVCTRFNTLAVGASDMIQKAGEGVLTRDAMKDVARVVGQLLAQIECSKEVSADGKRRKKKTADISLGDDEDEREEVDDDDDFETPTPQTVRFALVDIMCSLMRSSPVEFAEEVLPSFMQLVQKLVVPENSEADRSLAFYIADNVTGIMGPASVQYWQLFMNHALVAVLDKSPMVQQYATKVVGTGACQKEYAVMALCACQNVGQVLQKHGEKHKRRRVKAEQKPAALAVDACVRALGLICEHQESQLGAHAAQVWTMWLSSLPIKYDTEAGHQVHEQLLKLLAREHPALLDQARLPQVLKILTDVYKTKHSNTALDKNIAQAFGALGREKLEILCGDFKEGQKKKTEQMLKSLAKAAGGA